MGANLRRLDRIERRARDVITGRRARRQAQLAGRSVRLIFTHWTGIPTRRLNRWSRR
jgi:hypothetical protein